MDDVHEYTQWGRAFWLESDLEVLIPRQGQAVPLRSPRGALEAMARVRGYTSHGSRQQQAIMRSPANVVTGTCERTSMKDRRAVWGRSPGLSWLGGVLLLAALLSAREAGAAVGAPDRFHSLGLQMHAAYSHFRWKDYRTESLQLLQFLNGSPAAMLELARAEARNGNEGAAMHELRAIARMGVSQPELATLPDFAKLRTEPEFGGILRAMAANQQPVAHARPAAVIPDAGLLPEDLAYDPTTHDFLLSSVLEARIVAVSQRSPMRTFARAPDGWPMLALRIDTRHRALWATEVALTGFRSVPRRDWGRSIILEYDLSTRRLLRRIEGPAGSQLGDMALSPAGDLLVSDSNHGGLYRVAYGDYRLVRLPTNAFVSPMTPAFMSRDRAFVADYVRGIALLDLSTQQVKWLAMHDKHALQGTDGLYWYRGGLIAIQNGFAPERVLRFGLDGAHAAIFRERVIASGTPGLDPNHGVLVGSTFYYIANSGWNELASDGSLRRGARLTPAVIMRAQLAAAAY